MLESTANKGTATDASVSHGQATQRFIPSTHVAAYTVIAIIAINSYYNYE